MGDIKFYKLIQTFGFMSKLFGQIFKEIYERDTPIYKMIDSVEKIVNELKTRKPY